MARLLGLVSPPHEGLEDYTANPYHLDYPVYYDLEDKASSSGYRPGMAVAARAEDAGDSRG